MKQNIIKNLKEIRNKINTIILLEDTDISNNLINASNKLLRGFSISNDTIRTINDTIFKSNNTIKNEEIAIIKNIINKIPEKMETIENFGNDIIKTLSKTKNNNLFLMEQKASSFIDSIKASIKYIRNQSSWFLGIISLIISTCGAIFFYVELQKDKQKITGNTIWEELKTMTYEFSISFKKVVLMSIDDIIEFIIKMFWDIIEYFKVLGHDFFDVITKSKMRRLIVALFICCIATIRVMVF